MRANNTFISAALLFALLVSAPLTEAQKPISPPPPKERDDTWRKQELDRAKPLIRLHDFSPIDEAFAAKDIKLLWHYYICSYNLDFQLYQRITQKSLENEHPELFERLKITFESSQYAGRLLQKIPGHARFLGDLIEDTLYGRVGGMNMISTYISCLFRLGQDGSDECIEQLGRFLFDPRDPGFRPFDPAIPRSSPYDTRGVPNPVKDGAAAAMRGALQGRFAFAKTLVDENSKPFKNMPVKGSLEMVRNWWLTSAEAAPYRRSLAATGVVLPPSYPPMKELEGSACTIAPPLKNPPYPDPSPSATQTKPN